jgi:hypothetical protein
MLHADRVAVADERVQERLERCCRLRHGHPLHVYEGVLDEPSGSVQSKFRTSYTCRLSNRERGGGDREIQRERERFRETEREIQREREGEREGERERRRGTGGVGGFGSAGGGLRR